jgi:hypothetical protein
MHARVGVMRAINRHVERALLHRESIRIGDAGMPALTGSADIKLNTRLSLRAPTEKIGSRTGYFPDPPSQSRRSEHFPADGLV